RARLADLLGLQPLALEHVQEVGVAAEVQLVRAVDAHTAVHEQVREHAVRDRGPDLRLDVVADHRQALLLEPLLPVLLARDEHGDAVHERAAGIEHLLDVPLRRRFRADRQVVHDHVGLRVLEQLDDVHRGARPLLDDLRQVLAEPVVRHAALHGDAHVRDLGEHDGVVRPRDDRLGDVLADLVHVDVDRRRDLDVADVVPAQVHVHEPGDPVRGLGVAVVVEALHERRGAVPHADDRDSHLAHDAQTSEPDERVIFHTCAILWIAVANENTTSTISMPGITGPSPKKPAMISTTSRSGRSNHPTLHSSPSPSARARVYDTMNDPTSPRIANNAMNANVMGYRLCSRFAITRPGFAVMSTSWAM